MNDYIKNELKRRLLNKNKNKSDEEANSYLKLHNNLKKYITEKKEVTFNEKIINLINEQNIKPSTIYNLVNVDRRTFSKLYNKDYKPSKNTAICLCIGLKLSLFDTNDMLKRLGYTLSLSNDFDIIISYFLENGLYDVIEINCYLDEFNLELLGSKI